MEYKKKPYILFVYLTIFLIGTTGAFLWQFFLPELAEKYSLWNPSRGWQREIALWNAGTDVAVVITLIKRNREYAEILTLMITVLCLLLGANHFVSAIASTNGNTALHWIGTMEVLFFGTAFGVFALYKSCFINKLKSNSKTKIYSKHS